MTTLRDLTADEISTLAGIIAKLRPHGARRWDPAGVRAAFAKAAGLDAANVLMAAIRLSQDRTAQTPGQIAIPASECWRERPAEPTPTRAVVCRAHATQHHGICPSCRADELARETDQPTRPGHKLPPAQVAAIVGELRDIARPTTEEPR